MIETRRHHYRHHHHHYLQADHWRHVALSSLARPDTREVAVEMPTHLVGKDSFLKLS